jgi:hypothetical protein
MKYLIYGIGIPFVILFGLFIYAGFNSGGVSKATITKQKVHAILNACRAYSLSEPEGKCPAALEQIIGDDGGKSFLEGGLSAIKDPWGNWFKYAAVPVADGKNEFYVWSEREVDGKLVLIGAKANADGKIIWFGNTSD